MTIQEENDTLAAVPGDGAAAVGAVEVVDLTGDNDVQVVDAPDQSNKAPTIMWYVFSFRKPEPGRGMPP